MRRTRDLAREENMDALETGKVSREEYSKDGGSHVVRENRTQMERGTREGVLVKVGVDLELCKPENVRGKNLGGSAPK